MTAYSARRLARSSAALVAALALSGTLFATAHAEEPTVVPTTETSAPAVEPTSSTEPDPPATVLEPAPRIALPPEPSAPDAAAAADPAITVKVNGGPYLVGQAFTVEVTVTNHGPATANAVKAYSTSVSGSLVNYSGFGELGTPAGASIPAGEKLVVNVEARIYSWLGPPVSRFSIHSANDSSYDNNNFEVAVPVVAPDSGKGSVSGLIYGDANGNGSADAGEGLEGVRVALAGGELNPPKVYTGADGRFKFSDVALRNYAVYTSYAPNGWVLPDSRNIDVDGDEYLEYRAVRPLSDQLEASIDFTEDNYAVGQTARMTVVLTNKGGADISGVKAGCDRSGGEGPHVVDMAIGDLAWDKPGVTVGAGRSLTLTITGVVPPKAAGFGAVSVSCDFGPGDSPQGYPAVRDYARVAGAGPGDTWGRFYEDRDNDRIGDADEFLAGVKVAAFDAITGKIVAKTTTDAGGRLEFTNLPAGPYTMKVYGPWKFEYGQAGFNIGTCAVYCRSGWVITLLPGPDVPDTDVLPTPPTTDPSPPAGSSGGGTTGGGLANTGANTEGLTAIGLLVLIAGVGAVTATRRRRIA